MAANVTGFTYLEIGVLPADQMVNVLDTTDTSSLTNGHEARRTGRMASYIAGYQ
jgi:hypothetical protein